MFVAYTSLCIGNVQGILEPILAPLLSVDAWTDGQENFYAVDSQYIQQYGRDETEELITQASED